MSKSVDGGATFTDPVRAASLTVKWFWPMEMFGDLNISSIPTIAVDTTGYVYVAYTELYGTVEDPDYVVKYVWSPGGDNWTQWSEPATATDEQTNWQFFPWLTADPSGYVYLVYHDTREDENLVDVYLAESSGGGVGFSGSDIKVTSQSSDPDAEAGHTEYIGVASAAGYVHPLWGDWRHSTPANPNSDVYAALVAIEPLKGDINCDG
ncbi:MAG: hypothetical protein ACE5OR_16000, partial [bacterium]